MTFEIPFLTRLTSLIRAAAVVIAGFSFILLVVAFFSGDSLRLAVQRGLFITASSAAALAVSLLIFQKPLAKSLYRLYQDAREQWRLLSHFRRAYPLPRSHVWALTGLVVFGGLLRGVFLTQPIRTDEAVTYLHYASRSLPLALSHYSAPNNHLFHTLLAWISVHLLGNTEIALRLPAFLMGLLLIPVTYGAGTMLAHPLGEKRCQRVALLAAGLVAVSSVLIEYSVNARGYTLQSLIFALCIISAYSVRHSLSPVRWSGLALLLALGFYTVPTMLYPAGGLMLWLFITLISDRQAQPASRAQVIRAWVLCSLLTSLLTLFLYTPVLIVSGLGAVTSNAYVQPSSLEDFLRQMPAAAARLWAHWHTSIPPLIAVLLGSGVLISLGRGMRERVPLLVVCGLWSLVALCLQRVIPFERNWLPFLPLYFISAAAGLVWLWERWSGRQAWIGWTLGALLIAGLGANIILTRSPYLSTETGTFRDAQAVVRDLQAVVQPGDRIIFEHPSGDSLAYYAAQQGMDWQAFIDRESTTGVVYLVLNREYPQTRESVAGWNGIRLDDYIVDTTRVYPLAEWIQLKKKT